jgi:hypothetical protein
MPTATARHVAASGFGSTPDSRGAVLRGSKQPDPAPKRPTSTPVRSTSAGPAESAPKPAPKPTSGRRPVGAGRPAGQRRTEPDHRAPKLKGSLSSTRRIRIGSARAQHLLIGEMLLCLVVIVLADVMETGDVTSLPIEASAVAGLFLLLALVSTGGRGPERVAVALGGLVTLGVMVKRWGAFPALSATVQMAYGKAYGARSALAPDTSGAAALSPGPPVTSPVPPRNSRLSGGVSAV